MNIDTYNPFIETIKKNDSNNGKKQLLKDRKIEVEHPHLGPAKAENRRILRKHVRAACDGC
jgi:hypothetical protein